MSRELPKGTMLPTMLKANVFTECLLGEGGQGYVYKVKYNGKDMAAKIYKPDVHRDPKAFFKNLVNNAKHDAPSDRFLWPIDVIMPRGGIFGYIMPLRPAGYYELSDFMNPRRNVRFSCFRAVANAAIEMTTAFRILHSEGFSYQDLSAGNFFVEPNTGMILICDNDNVAANNNSGILGTPKYMAPEIVRGEITPDTFTDRFSLSVILFLIFTMTHPLEGRRFVWCNLLTPENEKILYGTDPVFVLDPIDNRNRPLPGVQTAIGKVWPELPLYMQLMFTKQFSRELLIDPSKRQQRATEMEWQELLIRFRGDIISCPSCKGESFGVGKDPGNPVCSCCKKRLPVRRYAKSGRMKSDGVAYSVPLMTGTLIYRTQVAPSNIDTSGDPILKAVENPKDPSVIALKNISKERIKVQRDNEPEKVIEPGKALAATPGTRVRACGGELVIV